ncbi:MAG: hypothetical protein K2K56_11155 [Lachnospiraceae bacterium]|nr:hypothetical protein [Lachnospiraceae bacterium]
MKSIGQNKVTILEFLALQRDSKTEVLIIDSGIAGILTAYFLKRAGVDL